MKNENAEVNFIANTERLGTVNTYKTNAIIAFINNAKKDEKF